MDGRPTGEANVDFSTHQEAVEAMKKHKTNMRKWLKNAYTVPESKALRKSDWMETVEQATETLHSIYLISRSLN